jgi:hypothetical protein
MEKLNRIMSQFMLPNVEDYNIVLHECKILLSFTPAWSDADIIAYLSCMEQVTPGIDEDIAIDQMMQLSIKNEG